MRERERAREGGERERERKRERDLASVNWREKKMLFSQRSKSTKKKKPTKK